MNPANFFHVDRDQLVTLQLIPDRTVRNWHVDDLARSLAELYRDPLTCFSREGYRPPEHFAFDIILAREAIRFYLTVPARWEDYARTKVASLWPRATITIPDDSGQPSPPGPAKPGKSASDSGLIPTASGHVSSAARLTLKNADFYSLHTARNDARPLPGLLEAAKDLRPGESVRVQIVARPGDRQQWEHEAMQAYIGHRQGKPPERRELTVGAAVQYGAKVADGLLQEVYDFATDMLGMRPEKKEPEHLLFDDRFAKLALMNRAQLTEATVRKIREPIFHTEIRILTAGADRERCRLLAKGAGGALNELASTDNEFIVRPVPERLVTAFARDVAGHRLPLYSTHTITLSASELGKLLQLPGAELQQEYPAIEQISQRETDLPAVILDTGGMFLGRIRCQGRELPVHIPVNNHDELCLPRIVIGGMGTGKTRGFGGNLIVQAVRHGFTAIAIDPARGELYAEAAAGLPPEKIVRVQFGVKPISLDWREVQHGATARSRLASELISFVETASDETGVQTMRYLRSAAKAVPHGSLTEIVELFTDPAYRRRLMAEMPAKELETWDTYDKMSDARQSQIAGPVLNRLDVITGDDYLAACLEAADGIDFVQLIDGDPKAIIIDLPKATLGAEAVDVLAALVATKLDLAMVLRKTQHPVFVIQDEPHQYLRSARTWKAATVESRKWRFAYVWMFHSAEQIPGQLLEIIKAAGPHYHLYSSSKRTYKELAEELAPWTVEEAMDTPTHYALNIIRAGGRNVPVFMAKMAPPPSIPGFT